MDAIQHLDKAAEIFAKAADPDYELTPDARTRFLLQAQYHAAASQAESLHTANLLAVNATMCETINTVLGPDSKVVGPDDPDVPVILRDLMIAQTNVELDIQRRLGFVTK